MARIDVDKIRQLLPLQNPEVTDPGIPYPPEKRTDEFISPPAENQTTLWKPVGWFHKHLAKRKNLKEANELVEKIELFPSVPDEVIRRYFDVDMPRLAQLSRLYPKEVHSLLEKNLCHSPIRKPTERWYRLVQIACGDEKAFLLALEGLC